MSFSNSKTELEEEVISLEDLIGTYNIILYNDDVNTFDWVIDTLMQICGHDKEQAEQCTLIIHFKGKCAVKSGDLDTLKPICDGITDRGIGATIEEAIG